jgi:hypothetical protein
MTYSRREEIFSKDYISIADIQDLLGMGYDDAAKLIRDIKRKMQFAGKELRLDVQGKLHVQDYLDYFRIPDTSRYLGLVKVETTVAN